MRVLVTGGAGFIGSHLIHRLLEGDHEVTAIDNFSAQEPARRRADVLSREQFTMHEHDVRNIAQFVRGMPHSPDAIMHLASPISVQESIQNPYKYRDEIMVATGQLLQCAHEQGIKRVVLASTAAVYGDPARVPVSEDAVMNPLVPYASEKCSAECLAQAHAEWHSLETVILRFFNVYGPGQDPSSPYSGVVSKFMERVKNRQPPVIFGDGTQTRDFVYVGDVVEAIMRSITQPVEPGLTVNIGSGTAVTIDHLARATIALGDTALEPIYEPPRSGDIKHSQADISNARHALDYTPRVTLEEGLRKTWEWFTAERKY